MLYAQQRAAKSKRLCYLMKTMRAPMAALMVLARQ